MIRITAAADPGGRARVVVEGRITKSSSAGLATVCIDHLTRGNRVALDLSGVTFADSEGVALVRNLIKRGCALETCSELVRTLVGEQSQWPKSDRVGYESEEELLARLRAGDHRAFGLVVQRYGGRMLATARRLLNNEHDAQDAVQEAFTSAFRGLDKFNGDAMLYTWLCRIVVNAALIQLRSRRLRRERPVEQLLPRFDRHGQWMDDPSPWADATETTLERRDVREMIRRCIEQLPEKYRCVLLLRDIEELNTQETAQLLSVSANTVKVRLHRARQALRTLIERDCGLLSNISNTQPSERDRSTSLKS
jgi:RNA polymerase sigma-70 factor, ECF subfamily